MKISYKWLLELTGLDWPVEEVAERLTLCGTACEEIEAADRYMDKVVVGEVLDVQSIEGADKIRQVTVDIGNEKLDLVCGAPNVAVGQKVPVALLGAKLAGDIEIKKVKIRGVESIGMICSERELGLSDDHSGIIVLESDAKTGRALSECLKFDDFMLTFELTPNRADSMSAIGIARDLAALAGVKVRKPEIKLTELAEKASDLISVAIENPGDCPRYTARVIKNVKMGPSPWWVKRKLITAGIRPISNVVDVTNLVMLETGQPLHAFDLDRFGSKEVVVRAGNKGEKFITLDGHEHELSSDVTMITNGKAGVAAGGVMGGMNSEIEESTTNILLEAAYFNPKMIRRSRRHLGFVTESSSRFEKGADPNGIPYAIDRAAQLFQELCGGEVCSGIVDCYPEKIEPAKINFRPSRCNHLLGSNITADRMASILTGLELEPVADGEENFEVTIPTFRPDLEREVDLIEEIVRIEGIDNIPTSESNVGSLFTPTYFIDSFKKLVRSTLTSSGFDEIISHGLADDRLADRLMPGNPRVRILNPVSQDLNVMRDSLAQTVLGIIGNNLAHRSLDLRLFEIGKTYAVPDARDNWVETEKLVIALTGDTQATWRDRARPLDFYDLTGALKTLMQFCQVDQLELEPDESNWFTKEISFRIVTGNQQVGLIGQVRPDICKQFDVKQAVFLAELTLEPFIENGKPLTTFESLPVYPAALRDLALVVDETVKVGDIVSTVKETVGDLAERVSVFDLYTGKQIERNKKSIAISISYRSQHRSLSSDEIDQRQQVAIVALKKKFDAEIRDK